MKSSVEHPPRSLFILFFKVGGTQTLMFVLWVLMSFVLSLFFLHMAKQFDQHGEKTNAIILEKTIGRDSDGDRKLFFQLSFATKAGEEIFLKRSVDRSDYEDAALGDEIEIKYLSNDPEKVEIDPGENQRMGHVFQFFAWVFTAPVLISLYIYSRRALDAFRARKYLNREEVELLEVKRTGWWVFGLGFRLIWRENTGREGKSLQHKAEKLMGLRPGDTIVVFHGEKHSWWAGDVGDRESP